MKKIIQIIVGLAGLSLVILVHEFGHFVACKAFGVGTPIFSIGFGPALLQHKIGQTVFQIAALPLGGYVALSPTDLAAQPYLHQLIIMLAGIAFNFLFAFIVFALLSHKRDQTPNSTDSILEDSPAKNTRKIHGHIKEAFHSGLRGMKESTQNIQQTLKNLFQEEGNSSGIVGPIGIIAIAGKSLSYGPSFFFLILAILSLNIGFFNLLPIPFFDGGQIVGLTFTALFGPIPAALSSAISRFFLIMLILLMLFLTFRDAHQLRRRK